MSVQKIVQKVFVYRQDGYILLPLFGNSSVDPLSTLSEGNTCHRYQLMNKYLLINTAIVLFVGFFFFNSCFKSRWG